MRFSSSIKLLALVPFVALAPFAACATALETEDASSSGSGGSGSGSSSSSASSSSSSSGMTGPCVNGDDCAAFSDVCNVGTCINAKCTKVPINEGVSCDDGKNCTQGDTCQTGKCTGGLQFCPASDSCHVGYCDVDTDTCVQQPGNDGQPCVDDDPCTQTGVCTAGACAPGKPIDCSFLDSMCDEGVCDPMLGCVQQPKVDGTPCQDGFYCTINDHCTAGACGGEPNVCAAPGDVCKIGSCNEANDTCTAVNGNDGGACNDNNACTTGEICGGGLCSGGSPANQGGACDDKDACTTVDICNNGACVGSGSIVQCVDGDGCCPAACSLADDSDCQPACCGDDINDFATSNNCGQGAQWIAWKYVPACSFNATRIELHTDAGNVALLADNNGAPGATLFQGGLGVPDPQGWLGADVSPPLSLNGGTTYWLAENVSLCSIASAGVPQMYYGSFNTLAGPWEGPYMGEPWTAHVIGQCAP